MLNNVDNKPCALDRINARRLSKIIETVIKEMTCFDENNSTLRENVKDCIEEILKRLDKKDYIIICDETNNTPDTIRDGKFIVDLYEKQDDGRYLNTNFEVSKERLS